MLIRQILHVGAMAKSEWKNVPSFPRHFEIEGSFLMVYDDENDFVVHVLKLSELMPMVTNFGSILWVMTKQTEKIVVANGLSMKEVRFFTETIEEAIMEANVK